VDQAPPGDQDRIKARQQALLAFAPDLARLTRRAAKHLTHYRLFHPQFWQLLRDGPGLERAVIQDGENLSHIQLFGQPLLQGRSPLVFRQRQRPVDAALLTMHRKRQFPVLTCRDGDTRRAHIHAQHTALLPPLAVPEVFHHPPKRRRRWQQGQAAPGRKRVHAGQFVQPLFDIELLEQRLRWTEMLRIHRRADVIHHIYRHDFAQ